MTTAGCVKRKDTDERSDLLDNEPLCKVLKLQDVAEEGKMCIAGAELASSNLTLSSVSTLPNNVSDWSATDYQKMCRHFKINKVMNSVNADTLLSRFSTVQVVEKFQEYIDSLKHCFEALNFDPASRHSSTVDTQDNHILPATVLNEILTRLRAAKEKLISNLFTRFPAAVSFLNDLKILSHVEMDNIGVTHLQMLFHSLLQSAGLHVRSGCDYTSQEEIFGTTFVGAPDMRIYVESHVEFKEPKIMATVKVGQTVPSVTDSVEHLPPEKSIANAVGELLLDFRHSQYPQELYAFIVHGTKVWLMCLRSCADDLKEEDRCRILVDRAYRWDNFMNSDKELLISQPLDYLCKEDREKLYETFAKFASVAGFASDAPISSARQKLYTR